MVVIWLLLACLWGTDSFGFALLAGGARLPVTIDSPQLMISVSSDHPDFEDKEEFLGGEYKDLPDDEFWLVLIQQAMNRWNDVDGSYVELTAEVNDDAVVDGEDQVFSIVTGKVAATAAAMAMPRMEGKTIVDCDVTVKGGKVSAKSPSYTLMHEIGHCLGLGHNHSDYDAVMGYSRNTRSPYLGADDKAGVIYLYSEDPSDPEELIGCGTIAGDKKTGPLGLLVYGAPLLMIILMRFSGWIGLSGLARRRRQSIALHR